MEAKEVYKAIAAVTKQCRRCGKFKPLEQITRNAANRDGYAAVCKPCHSETTIAWQRANPELVRVYQRGVALKRRYKVTREWYETKLAEQDSKCAICKRDASSFGRPLSVDHDHNCCAEAPACGKCNRGLLCGQCNTTLHSIERDTQWLQGVFAYLNIGKEVE